MYIFIDPTEAREGTRLDGRVVKTATVLNGLERETKADLLISPLSEPKLKSVTSSKRSRLALKKHCEAGILVQRKSGSDLLSSIPDLPFILDRMKAWCPRPFLLATGSFAPTAKGKAKCNGRTFKWDYNSLMGAVESWQISGGYVRFLHRDSDIVNWIGRMKKMLEAIQSDDPLVVSRPMRRTISYNSKEAYKELLMRLPGIGKVRAELVGDYCGSLAWSLVFLVDEDNAGQCGCGHVTINGIRNYLGLKSGQYIHIREEKFT